MRRRPSSQAGPPRPRVPAGGASSGLRSASGGSAAGAPVLIVNADDFGSAAAVNRAVDEAHRRGILTSASLMVTGAAFEDAVARARATPGLAVGLHLVLVQGLAAARPERIPLLADGDGRLPNDPVGLGLRLAVDPRLRRQVALEIEAQLERFRGTGLPLSHVDGHLNFHMHPAVLPRLAAGAAALGAHGIRLPRDELPLAWRHDRARMAQKVAWAAAFGGLSAWARPRLPAGLQAAARVFGLFQSGHVGSAFVLDVIERLPRLGSAELYLHPSTTPGLEPLGPNPADLATLLDPLVAEGVAASGVRLGTYAALAEPR